MYLSGLSLVLHGVSIAVTEQSQLLRGRLPALPTLGPARLLSKLLCLASLARRYSSVKVSFPSDSARPFPLLLEEGPEAVIAGRSKIVQ
jgi:hypothetical protein